MKREEKIANDYFISVGFDKIQHEPDGNIPPDFLLNDSIAVEVRRLNQHFRRQKNIIPLEQLEFKLIPRIKNLIKSIEAPEINSSAFLTISFGRPLKVDKKLISDIDIILHDHIQSIKEKREYNIRDNLKIRIWPTKRKLSHIYEIGIQSDHDSGGVIVGEIFQNLNIIIKEKVIKIEPYQKKYNEWWLLLIDHMGFGLDDLDISQLRSLSIETYSFKKVIILPPYNYKKVVIIDKFHNN
ncbi:MAG: hypothetical protein NTX93_02110 [Bacteroidia bacterium]|nr:hypothetical protein [Bacteroidia bacterium]